MPIGLKGFQKGHKNFNGKKGHINSCFSCKKLFKKAPSRNAKYCSRECIPKEILQIGGRSNKGRISPRRGKYRILRCNDCNVEIKNRKASYCRSCSNRRGETILRRRVARLGKKHSEETKNKMRDTWKNKIKIGYVHPPHPGKRRTPEEEQIRIIKHRIRSKKYWEGKNALRNSYQHIRRELGIKKSSIPEYAYRIIVKFYHTYYQQMEELKWKTK